MAQTPTSNRAPSKSPELENERPLFLPRKEHRDRLALTQHSLDQYYNRLTSFPALSQYDPQQQFSDTTQKDFYGMLYNSYYNDFRPQYYQPQQYAPAYYGNLQQQSYPVNQQAGLQGYPEYV